MRAASGDFSRGGDSGSLIWTWDARRAPVALQGVDGVWIEREPDGQRVVVIHYTPSARPTHLPQQVNGLPTRIVGGEPIRAQ
ncbi:MAG TPA: hypothetical protein PLB41_07190 [Rubrivivax sp.]|nr:hypothetical protein [Rubrivivax sp.]HPO19695.1 hypothetical protein [Rubrivivax sp.]